MRPCASRGLVGTIRSARAMGLIILRIQTRQEELAGELQVGILPGCVLSVNLQYPGKGTSKKSARFKKALRLSVYNFPIVG